MDTLFSNLVKTFLKLIQLTSSRDCFVIVSNIPLPIHTHTHTHKSKNFSLQDWCEGETDDLNFDYPSEIKLFIWVCQFFFSDMLFVLTLFGIEGQRQIINAHNDFNLPRLKYPESNRLKATRCHHFFFFVFGNALFH